MLPSAFQVCEPYKECPEIKTPMPESTNSNRNNQAPRIPWDKVGLSFGVCALISCLILFVLMGFAAVSAVSTLKFCGGKDAEQTSKSCVKSSTNNISILKRR